MRYGLLLGALVALGCARMQDDGFPEALRRGCAGDQECWNLKKQTVFHQDACAARQLPEDECRRLDAVVADLAAEKEAAKKREIDALRQADADRERARVEEKRQRAESAWTRVGVEDCRIGQSCQAVDSFILEFPESAHRDEAIAARDEGRVIREKRAEEERREYERKQEAESEALRKADRANGSATAGHCCDGTAFSQICVAKHRGCCSHHGGVCAEKPPVVDDGR